jgi:hypothetical protein
MMFPPQVRKTANIRKNDAEMASIGITFVTSFSKSDQLFQKSKLGRGADKHKRYDAYFLPISKAD